MSELDRIMTLALAVANAVEGVPVDIEAGRGNAAVPMHSRFFARVKVDGKMLAAVTAHSFERAQSQLISELETKASSHASRMLGALKGDA